MLLLVLAACVGADPEDTGADTDSAADTDSGDTDTDTGDTDTHPDTGDTDSGDTHTGDTDTTDTHTGDTDTGDTDTDTGAVDTDTADTADTGDSGGAAHWSQSWDCSAPDAPASGVYALDTPASWRGEVPAGASDPAVGDLDGDGLLDVVVPTDTEVTVLHGYDGAILAEGTPVSGNADAAHLGDLDGDGVLDLVTAATTVSVHPGAGDGTFAAAVATDPGCAVLDLAVADADGDGDPDVWAACELAWALGENDGAGALTWTSSATTHAIDEVVLGDFDGDGAVDAAFGGGGPRKVTFVVGGAQSELGISTALLGSADALLAGDPDADGDTDVIVAQTAAPDTVLLANDGTGTFTEGFFSSCAWSYEDCGFTDRMALIPRAAGYADIIGYGTTGAWFVDGSGTATYDQLLWGHGETSGWAFADLDGDGESDGIGVSDDGRLTVIVGQGYGQFPDWTFDADNGAAYTYGDLDGDGADEFVTHATSYKVYRGDTWEEVDRARYVDSTDEIVTGDADGDGDLDILAAAYGIRAIRVLTMDGGRITGTVTSATAFQPEELEPADLDGDGDTDLVAKLQSYVEVLLADAGTYASAGRYGRGSDAMFPAVGDYDADGVTDFVYYDYRTSTFLFMQGDGTGAFTRITTLSNPAGDHPYAVEAGDPDGDGDTDLLVTIHGAARDVYVIESHADWTFTEHQTSLRGTDNTHASPMDLDGDGADEVIAQLGLDHAGIYTWDGSDLAETQRLPTGPEFGYRQAWPFIAPDGTVGIGFHGVAGVYMYRTCP